MLKKYYNYKTIILTSDVIITSYKNSTKTITKFTTTINTTITIKYITLIISSIKKCTNNYNFKYL